MAEHSAIFRATQIFSVAILLRDRTAQNRFVEVFNGALPIAARTALRCPNWLLGQRWQPAEARPA
jgi:hypothetical protein